MTDLEIIRDALEYSSGWWKHVECQCDESVGMICDRCGMLMKANEGLRAVKRIESALQHEREETETRCAKEYYDKNIEWRHKVRVTILDLRKSLRDCVDALYEAIEIVPLDRIPRKAGNAIQNAQAILEGEGK